MNSVTIIADASFCPFTKAGGYGCWITGNFGRKAFQGPLALPQDNNIAEAMAIVNALWHGIKSSLIVHDTLILIRSDSDTAIKLLNGDLNSDKLLIEQYKRAVLYITALKERYRLTIRFKHVNGHTSGKSNIALSQQHCDNAARNYMQMQRLSILQSNPELAKKYSEINEPKKRNSNYLRSKRRVNHG